MELTREKLEEMASVDIRTVDIDTLTDLRDIKIDTKAPVKKKLASFAEQTNKEQMVRMVNRYKGSTKIYYMLNMNRIIAEKKEEERSA